MPAFFWLLRPQPTVPPTLFLQSSWSLIKNVFCTKTKLSRKIKILSAISRILFCRNIITTKAVIYLAATLLLQSCCLPSTAHCCQCSKRAACLLFSTSGICGITACKVYPSRRLPSRTVSSYLTFSPLPLCKKTAVIFCGTFSCFTAKTAGS